MSFDIHGLVSLLIILVFCGVLISKFMIPITKFIDALKEMKNKKKEEGKKSE